MKYLILLICLGALPALRGQSPHSALREGDRHYDKKEFGKAEEAYRQADKDATGLYNLGNSIYRQGKYPDAARLYKESADALSHPEEKADALHNLGNAHIQQRRYKDAVAAYTQSLRLRPGDPDTKVNLQLAKKLLAREQARQQQEKDQQQQQQQDQQPSPGNGNDDQPQGGDNQDSGQQPQQSEDTKPLSEEEARRLLETAVGPEDAKNARKYREKGQPPPKTRPKKDW
jgi:tetratricopeptide (TPR) repeat protein